MIQLKVNRQEIQDPELALQIFSLRKRVDKAVDLVDRVKPLEDVPGMYQVKSSKSDEVYLVNLAGSNGPTCSCMDYTIRGSISGVPCKNIVACELRQDQATSLVAYAEIY